MDVTIPRTAGPASARAETAPLTATSVPQYSHHAILAIWAAAALPMAALAWVVAPAVAARLPGDGALPMAKALLASLTAGLVWQFFLVLILVRREQGTLRWSVMRDALWLRSPRSPRGGRVGGRLWLIVAFGLAGMNEPHGCLGWNDEDHHHARGRDWPEGRDPAVQRPRPILAIWRAAALPVAALGWLVLPLFAARSIGAGSPTPPSGTAAPGSGWSCTEPRACSSRCSSSWSSWAERIPRER